MLLLNALHMLANWGLSYSNVPQFQPISRCLTTFDQLHILPFFGIYKQVPLDCLPLAICKSQRKPSGARYARWESYVWEDKPELCHTTDFLVNCCIYSYEIIQKREVIALRLWKNLQKEIESKSLRKNRRQTYSIDRGGWWTWVICNINYSHAACAVFLQYDLDHF